MDVLKKVLEEIEPSGEEEKKVKEFAKNIIKLLKRYAGKKEVVLAGSIAKKTYLSKNADVDIFVVFSEKTPKIEMKKQLEKMMMGAFPGTKYQLNYAEHPYIRFHVEGRRIDLVPAYKMKPGGERLTAVDRSVLHTKYVLRKLEKKQRKDVLLLKQMLKANGIYGAEIKIEGFSGYLCELLIIRYGSFRKLMRAAEKWKLPVIVDLKKYYKPKDKEMLVEKFGSEFIVVDPTDKNRNVAAAVSEKNLKKFLSLCKKFNKKPSVSIFLKKQESFRDRIKSKKKYFVYLVEIPKPDVVDDVLWGQLKKLVKQLEYYMEEYKPGKAFADVDKKIRIAVPVKEDKTLAVAEYKGPPVKMQKHADKFRKKHKKAIITEKKGHLFAVEKRKPRDAMIALKDFFKKYSKKGTHLSYPLSKINIRLFLR